MLLAIDIGNTNIKSALFSEDELEDFKVHSNSEAVLDYIEINSFKNAAICSVNPTMQEILYEKIYEKGISAFRVNIKQKLNLNIKYETPETLGMDRVCSVVGALEIVKKENINLEHQYLMTIDFGTATTVNIVSPKREFIGGLISPGIKTMLNSLNKSTAQLPLPDLRSYKGLVGNSTNSSIISGVVTATIGMINETVIKLKMDSNQQPIIFATGGNSNFIIPQLKHKIYLDEAIVLKGLKLIRELNNE